MTIISIDDSLARRLEKFAQQRGQSRDDVVPRVLSMFVDQQPERSVARGKWAKIADDLRDLNLLDGSADEVNQLLRDTRDDFHIPRS